MMAIYMSFFLDDKSLRDLKLHCDYSLGILLFCGWIHSYVLCLMPNKFMLYYAI